MEFLKKCLRNQILNRFSSLTTYFGNLPVYVVLHYSDYIDKLPRSISYVYNRDFSLDREINMTIKVHNSCGSSRDRIVILGFPDFNLVSQFSII